VGLHIPGCPPSPAALLEGLLALMRGKGKSERLGGQGPRTPNRGRRLTSANFGAESRR
jgi:Ni,Fe-hydrogenase III small subunit